MATFLFGEEVTLLTGDLLLLLLLSTETPALRAKCEEKEGPNLDFGIPWLPVFVSNKFLGGLDLLYRELFELDEGSSFVE